MSEANAPEQPITTKSLLRHRPISEPGVIEKEQAVAFSPTIQRSSRLSKETTDTKAPITKRITAIPRGKQSLILPYRHNHTSLPGTRKMKQVSTITQLSRLHPLVLLGVGMIMMLLIWTLLSTVLNWANRTLNTLHYGNPPTYQVDAYVGHNEHLGQPSHFIVVNLHRHIDIIEIEGSDPAHTHIYSGPQLYGTYDDATPATLSFVTPPGTKYPNMILHIGNTQLTYLNNGQTFISSSSGT